MEDDKDVLRLLAHFLRDDRVTCVTPYDSMPAERITQITAERRVVVVADLEEPLLAAQRTELGK